MSKFYVSTAIAYVNAAPHIGFALESIQADALARYHRLKGDDVFFQTGTDEHGVKMYEVSKEQGISTQELADMNAEKFKALRKILNLSTDNFIRTTEESHKKGVQDLWKILDGNGDIYKDSYEGLYCVGCENFLGAQDVDDQGNCLIHKRPPKKVSEENYFFRLSKYSDQIKKAIESGELQVVPESRKNEMLKLIGDEGLKDVSFSRPKEVLPWGIDVPGDPEHVMYVWPDALTNYMTGVGYGHDAGKFEQYWPCDVHLIGKDILRFHAGIWIGMLLSAGIDLPKAIYVHGFITSEGQKMSKSIGNVVDPLEYVEQFGADVLRYFLLREIPTTDDGDFSRGRFVTVVNSELANGLGNLVNRVVMMTEKYLDGVVPEIIADPEFESKLKDSLQNYVSCFEKFDIKQACETLIKLVEFGNKYIDDKKPWIMAKEEDKDLPKVLYNLLELLRAGVIEILPVMPESAEKIAKQLNLSLDKLSLDFEWGNFEKGQKIQKAEALFARIEED